MTISHNITTFSALSTYVQSLKTGDTFNVGAGSVEPLLIENLASLGIDSITLTVSSFALAADITITGTGEIMSMAGSTIILTFARETENSDEMTLTIAVSPTAAESIPLIENSSLSGGTITFRPHAKLKVYFIDLDCNISIGDCTIPVFVDIPAYPDPGYWVIGTGKIKEGMSITDELFKALSNDMDMATNLPSAFGDLSKFRLNEIELSFNPIKSSFAFGYFSVTFTDGWSIFGPIGIDKGETLTLDFKINFANGGKSYAELIADFVIEESVPVELGAHLAEDNFFVWGRLQAGKTVSINTLFSKMRVALPRGFPEVLVDSLSLQVDITGQSFTFYIGLDLSSAGVLTMGPMSSSMTVSGTQASGNFTGTLVLDETTTLFLSADYAPDGLSLIGEAQHIEIGDIIAYLARKVHITDAPVTINRFELQSLTTTYETSSSSFSFDCNGSFALTGTPISSDIKIALSRGVDETGYAAVFDGKLTIGTSGFKVKFSKNPVDTSITAEWTSTDRADHLQFTDIATTFGFPPPQIPSDLDLSLKSASLTYDFTNETLVLGAESTNYGDAAFVAIKNSSGKHDYFFLLAIPKKFDLSNLPLVGAELGRLEKISVDSIRVILSSAASIDSKTAGTVNTLIASLGNGYPTLPTSGMVGDFMLVAQVDFGSEQLPLHVGMGGPKGAAAVTQPAGPDVPSASQTGVSPAPGGTAWANVQKSFGPVSVQRIGARYLSSAQSLWFEIDASLAMGPLTVSTNGLGIGSSIKDFEPRFSLRGMGIAWSRPPLEVAGAFANMNPAKGLEFEGGVTIGAESFELQAFGFYGDQAGAPSLFIFGDIAEDFGGPPAFFVTGAALGFGYNSHLRLPSVDQVADFPFVQVLPDSNPPNGDALPDPTPQGVLQTIMGTTPPWVSQRQGSLWFAAGITFTSFDIVNSQALVAVETGADLTISLLGTSRAQFPQQGDEHYANIVLDLDAVFRPEDGAFTIQAVLDKSSFLIDPACVLTGGFALCIWYGDNPHAGDFVLTLGGYGPGFPAPSYYPAEPRLGFHWALDSSITIGGNAYLAFTPSVMMLGGELAAVYHSGNLRAWFDAHADVVVFWKPFWFDANIGISVGASYRVDLWLTSFTASVELGCDLELWGPPTGGHVHVDWYIISFTIPFGTDNNHAEQKLSWSDVEAMLPNAGKSSSRNILSLTPTAGVMPPLSQSKPSQSNRSGGWVVRRGSFAFKATSLAPVTTATAGPATNHGSLFHVATLDWSGVSASQVVTITDSGGNDATSHFRVSPIHKNLPASLWGAPARSTPTGDDHLVKGQLVGLSLEIHPPRVGASAGPVAKSELQHDDLQLSGAVLPFGPGAPPTGSAPAYSAKSIDTITSPNSGIAATATVAARDAIYNALGEVGYDPVTTNSDMSGFSRRIGAAFNAEPLLVA